MGILRTREEKSDLKERFAKNNVFLCEHHFEQDNIDTFSFNDAQGRDKVRKKLQTGSLPTLNLPVKTLDNLPGSSTTPPQPRRILVSHDTPSTSTALTQRLMLRKHLRLKI